MRNEKVRKTIENLYRRLRGDISQAELERLNKSLDHQQLTLGIGAATEAPRRTVSG